MERNRLAAHIPLSSVIMIKERMHLDIIHSIRQDATVCFQFSETENIEQIISKQSSFMSSENGFLGGPYQLYVEIQASAQCG